MVDAALPTDAAFGKTLRVFFEEEGFGFPVAHLLFEVSPGRSAAVMPNEGGAAEPEGVSGVAESPAKVDVVSGGVELFVESADLIEGGSSYREVAAGEVLGGGVVEHDVGGCAGRGGSEREGE